MVSFQETLLVIQFVVAVWQLLQLTPLALVMRAVYLYFLERLGLDWICLSRRSSERIVLDGGSSGGGSGVSASAAMSASDLSSNRRLAATQKVRLSPIIYAWQTYDYLSTARMYWPSDHEGSGADHDELSGMAHFECTWLGRKLKFTRRRDATHPHAYFITCESRRRRRTYYVPDSPNRIWADLHDYFKVKCNITLKYKFKLVAKLEYVELCTYCEVLDRIIVKGQRVSVGGPSVFIPKPATKETKLLACLNLLGLYGQLYNWHVAPIAAITLVSSFLQFFESARERLYAIANDFFVACVQTVVDNTVPLKWRAFVYSLRDWVPNLQPCNDVQMRVVRGAPGHLYFFSFGNVECGDLCKVTTPLESIPRVPNTYSIQSPDATCPTAPNPNAAAKLIGGFGHDKGNISTNPNDFTHVIAVHICHLGSGALRYCRGCRVRVKSLKESFRQPYYTPVFDPAYHMALWKTTTYVIVR